MVLIILVYIAVISALLFAYWREKDEHNIASVGLKLWRDRAGYWQDETLRLYDVIRDRDYKAVELAETNRRIRDNERDAFAKAVREIAQLESENKRLRQKRDENGRFVKTSK